MISKKGHGINEINTDGLIGLTGPHRAPLVPCLGENSDLTLPLFGGNYPIIILDNMHKWLYMHIKGFIWIRVFHDHICYTKIGGNKNSQNDLNVMVNYYCHGENRIITW